MKRKDALKAMVDVLVTAMDEGYELMLGSDVQGLRNVFPSSLSSMFTDDELIRCLPTLVEEMCDVENKKGKKVLFVKMLGPDGMKLIIGLEETINREIEVISKLVEMCPENK